MATYTVLRAQTAALLGKNDSTATAGNEVRDALINLSRTEIFTQYPFSWLRKAATITITANAGDMPTDFNPEFPLVKVQDNNGNRYRRIAPKDAVMFTGSKEYVFWITYTTKWVINTVSAPTSLAVIYQYNPVDLSTGTDVDVCPDSTAIAYRAASKVMLLVEKNEQHADRLANFGEQRLQKLIENEVLYNDDKDNLKQVPDTKPIMEVKKK